MGALVQGIDVEGRAYASGWWDWLTLFSLFTGVALVVGYALLGATWLILKTEDRVQRRAFDVAFVVASSTLVLIGIVSLWTPLLNADYLDRWFGWPNMLHASPIPLLVALAAYVLIKGLFERREVTPFLAAQSLFVLSFVGIGISCYSYIVPRSVTIHAAAVPDNSLSFLLWAAAVLIPLILTCTAYSYWVFRGKVKLMGGITDGIRLAQSRVVCGLLARISADFDGGGARHSLGKDLRAANFRSSNGVSTYSKTAAWRIFGH